MVFALQPKRAVLSSRYHDVVKLFRSIRDNPTELLMKLKGFKNSEHDFFRLLSMDTHTAKWRDVPDIFKAARLMYLKNLSLENNNMHVNTNNYILHYCNSPDLPVADGEAVYKASGYLNNMNLNYIVHSDYKKIIGDWAGTGDFVFFDPPVNEEGWWKAEFAELKMLCDTLTDRGTRWVISTSTLDMDFILDFFKDYDIHNIGTEDDNEIIIRNFTDIGDD